nr:bifunctional folylpolyglutamate synthase/dihydrofolate synthase [Desulfobulbaceae bacterium]
MNYKEAWQFLDNLQFFTIKLGLDSMNLFLERLESPHKKMRYVHVAGTNGKGSVSATLLAVLSSAGYTVGFYSSPHLSSVRERFRINSSYIDEDTFARLSKKIIDVLGDDHITYFEFTTTLAFLWFAENEVDIAIMEVGMGGRLDATNVITPLVSVITNISIDHKEHLGETITCIAGEKAGIIKPCTPVVCGDLTEDAKAVVETVSRYNQALTYSYNKDFSCLGAEDSIFLYKGVFSDITGLRLKLSGQFQLENAAIALAALEILKQHHFVITDDSVRQGIAQVDWPGRLEFLEIFTEQGQPKRFILDGAHNLAGVTALVDTLHNQFAYEKLILVWASMKDKDYAECLALVLPLADQIIFTMPDKNRSATVTQLQACVDSSKSKSVLSYEKVTDAVSAAMEIATEKDLICVSGSLYLVGYARLFLCGEIVDG